MENKMPVKNKRTVQMLIARQIIPNRLSDEGFEGARGVKYKNGCIERARRAIATTKRSGVMMMMMIFIIAIIVIIVMMIIKFIAGISKIY